MATVTYAVTATINKVNSDNTITINGVGKHCYEKSKDEVYNLLEEKNDPLASKLIKQDVSFFVVDSNTIMITVLSMAMLNKKPLKLTISEDNSIMAIEVP